jgi:hypothetical protein
VISIAAFDFQLRVLLPQKASSSNSEVANRMKLRLLQLSFCTPQVLTLGLVLFSAQPALAFSLKPFDSRLNISVDIDHVGGGGQGYLPLIKTRADDSDNQTDSLNPLNAQATVSNSAYGWNTVNEASSSAVFHNSDSGTVSLNNSFSTTLPYSPVGEPFRTHMGVGLGNSFAYWFDIPSGGKLIIDYDVMARSDHAGLVNSSDIFSVNSSDEQGWTIGYALSVGTGSVEFVHNTDSPSSWGFSISGSTIGIGINTGVTDPRYFDRRGLFNWRFEPFPIQPNNNDVPTAVPTPMLLPGLIGMFIKVLQRNKEENTARKEAIV